MPPKVFVSYSHDNDAHRARVAEFVARLRREGLTVVYDEDLAKVGGPVEGWPRWCERQIVECDYVLACCTAMFHHRFDAEPGAGVVWEAQKIRQYLYENANLKVRSLIFEEGDRSHIPDTLRPYSFFLATNDRSYADLLGWLQAGTITSATPPAATAGPAAPPRATVDWPPPANDFPRHLADRKPEFGHFSSMLAGRGPQRILLVQGPSNSGKTALINECIAYARHQGVPYSHVDFKGGPPLEDVFETLVTDLGEEILAKACICQPSARTHPVIANLQQLRKPLFLAFDTFEDASETSQNWIGMLLSRIDRCPALVVAVAGRKVPEHSARSWASFAYAASLPPIPSVEDWMDFVERTYGATGVTSDQVKFAAVVFGGDPGQMFANIDAFVRASQPR